MHEAPAAPQLPQLRPPEQPTLPTTAAEVNELFHFMSEAELRFETLRMRILDRRQTTHGEELEIHEVWVRHPGSAKVITTYGEHAVNTRDYDAWIGDGTTVRTFDARAKTATNRRVPLRPVGVDDERLPAHARVYLPVTVLPAETLADTFIHPHGYCRNVLATGVISRRGTQVLANGREAILLRVDHPRTSHVLTDRPDHWLEIGVDFQTGLILLLAEHVGDRITRDAQVIQLALDEPITDDVFRLHISSDTRTLY
jgi:hypothetical protein